MDGEASRKAAASLSPDLRELLANLWRGATEPKSLVDWATNQLVAGRDSHNLRILAGLSGEDRGETEDYFAKALTDLRIPQPDRRECSIQYCGDVARDVLRGGLPPLTAFAILWQVTMKLAYPAPWRCWTQLEGDLDVMEYKELPTAEREEAVRKGCEHFLAVLEGYTETGLARLSMNRSLEALRARGWNVPASADQILKRAPAMDDDNERLSFFRTRVDTEDFRNLTIPWTLFCRSEIVGCRFENCDLSESSMTWCDWKNCDFRRAALRGSDLRRSVFENCGFYEATLDGADLRGAKFADCRFGRASMKGAKLESLSGCSKASDGVSCG